MEFHPEREAQDVVGRRLIKEITAANVDISRSRHALEIDGAIAGMAGMPAAIGGKESRALEKPKMTIFGVGDVAVIGSDRDGPGVAKDVGSRLISFTILSYY